MKELNLLVWLTQLGLGTAAPMAAAVYLGLWLQERFQLGVWVVVGCIALGVFCGISCLLTSLKAMEKMSAPQKKEEKPPVSFNNHL